MTRILFRFQQAAKLEAIHTCHHDITDYQIRNDFDSLIECLHPVRASHNPVLFTKIRPEIIPDIFIVINHHNQWN